MVSVALLRSYLCQVNPNWDYSQYEIVLLLEKEDLILLLRTIVLSVANPKSRQKPRLVASFCRHVQSHCQDKIKHCKIIASLRVLPKCREQEVI